jgi:diamine N-acetyltransferase
MNLIKNDILSLRAVEPEDIDALFKVENNLELWKYSNRSQPYSKDLLQNYISNAHKGVFETRQVKFTVANLNNQPVGFIDLFDFEPLHHRAGVGLAIQKQFQDKGYGTGALVLLGLYAKKYLQLHQLYANIAVENKISIQLFKCQGYHFVGTKKDWNFYDDKYHDESIYQKII